MPCDRTAVLRYVERVGAVTSPVQNRTTMALIVHKYGGTSMGSVERIKNVAQRVAKWHKAGHKMVVVPSAMPGGTNPLLGLAKEITSRPSPRGLDMIASTGAPVCVGP